MFVWIRGHSEILDWTPRPVTVLLYNCVPSLLAPGLHSQWAPGCSLPSSEHGSQAGAVAVASKRCSCLMGRSATTSWSFNSIQTNLGIEWNTSHQQSRSGSRRFPCMEVTPAYPWSMAGCEYSHNSMWPLHTADLLMHVRNLQTINI